MFLILSLIILISLFTIFIIIIFLVLKNHLIVNQIITVNLLIVNATLIDSHIISPPFLQVNCISSLIIYTAYFSNYYSNIPADYLKPLFHLLDTYICYYIAYLINLLEKSMFFKM